MCSFSVHLSRVILLIFVEVKCVKCFGNFKRKNLVISGGARVNHTPRAKNKKQCTKLDAVIYERSFVIALFRIKNFCFKYSMVMVFRKSE